MTQKTVRVDGTDVQVTVEDGSAEAEVLGEKERFVAELQENDAVVEVCSDGDVISFSYDPSEDDFNSIMLPDEFVVETIDIDISFSEHDNAVFVDGVWNADETDDNYVRFTSNWGNDIVLRADADYLVESNEYDVNPSVVYYDDDMRVDELCESGAFKGNENDDNDYDCNWKFTSKEKFSE